MTYVTGLGVDCVYLEPLLCLLLALHGQNQRICPLVDYLKFMLLLFAIFRNVSDATPIQSQLHLGGLVFGGLVTLKAEKGGKRDALMLSQSLFRE